MKNVKRIISVVMVIITVFASLSVGAFAASSPTWKINSVTDITETNAKISGLVTFPSKVTVTEGGFYIGTSSTDVKNEKEKNTEKYYDKGTIKNTQISVSFLMSKYKVKLKANTTYYYKFYVIADGKKYPSAVKSFKTAAGLKDSWKINSPTELTYDNARINSVVTFSRKVTVTEGGFYIGESSNDLVKTSSPDKNKVSDTKISLSFLMSKYYGKLKANKTYYYKFYVVVDGKSYPSEVKTFKTKAAPSNSKVEPTQIYFPLPTNQVWYASTYVGHGEKVKAAYSSVDITLKNGKSCRGYAVYAVEEGKVYHIDLSNGQVTIKHTKKLVTTNGVTYNTWYSLYAHMSNISVKNGDTVKRGQQIGKVSDVGKATGPHLHLTLASDYNGKGMFNQTSTKSAISPYYVYGFVSKDAKNTSYLVRDTKGIAVTAKLINHKPKK